MYVVGYPKSGNTWLSYLLSYCLNSAYDDLDEPGIHPRDEKQRSLVKGGHSHVSHTEKLGPILKTHALKLHNPSKSPVVYLVRDGRDVMVSYYFYQRNFSDQSSWKKKIRILFEKGKMAQGSFSDFLQSRLPEWVAHIDYWLKQNIVEIVKYEHLHAQPQKVLTALFSQLITPVDPVILSDAIELFSFKSMSNRTPGQENRQSFFRKGISGDWKNHFSQSDIDYFQDKAGDVMEHLGYSL